MKEVNFSAWLKWFLIFMLSSLGFVVYYSSGLFWKVHETDITSICHIIMVVFFFFSIRVGRDTYNVCIDISKGNTTKIKEMDERDKFRSLKSKMPYEME